MKNLAQYSIPFKGLNDGLHELTFKVNAEFFQHFEESYLDDGNVEIKVDLDKRPSMMVLDIDFSGTVKTLCDLCGDEGDLPIEGTARRRCVGCADKGREKRTKTLCSHCQTPFCKDCFATCHS